MKWIIVVTLALAASPAAACIRMPGMMGSAMNQIESELRYLVCLHNEQQTELGRQAREIQQLRQFITAKDTQIMLLEHRINRIASSVATLPPPLLPVEKTPEEQRQLDETMNELRDILTKTGTLQPSK